MNAKGCINVTVSLIPLRSLNVEVKVKIKIRLR